MALDKILQGFKDVADNQACIQEEAMICAHRIDLHGLKRLHRRYSHKFHKHGLCIDNFAQDYGSEVKMADIKKGYTMSDLKDHFTKFIPKLESDLEKLKKLNLQFIQECGMEYKEGVCMQEHLNKLWMKMKFRWVPQFEFTKWNPLDIIRWDKWLHDKCRCEDEANHMHFDEHR